VTLATSRTLQKNPRGLDKFLGSAPSLCENRRQMAPKRPRPNRSDISPQDRAMFLEAINGTVALSDSVRVLAPLPAPPPRAQVIERGPPPVAKLHIEVEADRYRARAAGVSKAQVADLAAGKRHIAATLDLHGKTTLDGAEAVRAFLLRQLAGQCVLIIHGKGLHSDGLALMRDATIEELLGPSSGMVQAFATAAPKDGGEGATYVLVKR
jgi:DNA-nicking Smr family endonuclease